MNLLKVIMMMILAASLSVILNNTAYATDHPWDDDVVDSSEGTGYSNEGGTPTPKPEIDKPILRRLTNWAREYFRNFSIWGMRVAARPETRKQETRKFESPVSQRKFK